MRRVPTLAAMRFDGQVWFDFGDRAVWDFYAFIRALAGRGTEVALEWKPFVSDDQATMASTFLGLDRPDERGRFLHAALGLVHLEGEDPAADETVRSAMAIARITGEPRGDTGEVASLRSRAIELGVRRVPSLYRHGPVVAVTVNGAATTGDVEARAGTILAMLDDDGIWELTKP